MKKIDKIEKIKKKIGSRNDRKLKRYSDKFNEIFNFYLSIYRHGLITFCGSNFKVDFDINGNDGKFSFREYDNGRFKYKNPVTRHPNILYGVISGKKGWGLWCDQWTDGIVDWSFTEKEILNEFDKRNIIIPESLFNEFKKLLDKKKLKRNIEYLEQLKII